jgi:hypothetical protein
VSDAELAYMCPHTSTYRSSYSSYYYMSICSESGVPDAELASPAIIPADLGKYGGRVVVTGQVKNNNKKNRIRRSRGCHGAGNTTFTCFSSTKEQILTPEELCAGLGHAHHQC